MNFAGYEYLANLIVFAEIGVIVFAYRRRPVWAIYATVLSIFLKGQYLWVGRALYAWQIAALLGLVFLMMGRSKNNMLRPGKALADYRFSVQGFFVYTYLISIPFWLIFSAEGLGGVGAEVSTSRVITQTIFFGFLVGLFGIGLWAGRYLTAINLLGAIIMIATIVAYGAFVQVLIVRFVGINVFPIIGSDGAIQSAYINQLIFRATSFSGEPKHLGLIMSAGLSYCFLARLQRIPLGGRFAIHKPLAMIVALILSLSTTGFIVVAACIGLSAVIFFSQIRVLDMALAGIAVVTIVTQVIGIESDFTSSLFAQLSKGDVEVQDQSVRQAILNDPLFLVTGTGLGNIHLFAVEYLPPDFPLFKDHGYKGNSGLWYIIGDSGLIGLAFLLIGPLIGMQSYLQMRRHLTLEQRRDALTALAIALVTLVSFLLRFDVLFFLTSGFVITRLAILRTEAMASPEGRTLKRPAGQSR